MDWHFKTMILTKEVNIPLKRGQADIVLPLDLGSEGVVLDDLREACRYFWEIFGPWGRRRPRSARFLVVYDDVFAGARPVYPKLLSQDSELSLSADELSEEIELLLELRDPNDVFAGPYIYSILVTQPLRMTALLQQVEDSVGTEVRRGYIYHEFLYKADPDKVWTLLEALLDCAEQVEITLRPAHGLPEERKRVSLRAAPVAASQPSHQL